MHGFKYLGSTITVDGSEEREVTRMIQAGWKNWSEVSGVLCDRRIPVKAKAGKTPGSIKKNPTHMFFWVLCFLFYWAFWVLLGFFGLY